MYINFIMYSSLAAAYRQVAFFNFLFAGVSIKVSIEVKKNIGHMMHYEKNYSLLETYLYLFDIKLIND